MSRAYMQALDVQLDLIRFWKGYYGPRVAEYWANMLKGGRGHELSRDADGHGPHMDLGTPEQFAGREARSLDSADTFWVSHSMVDMINDQRERLPSYELRSNDIPARRGFVFLAHPIYILDRNQRRCNVRAFSWETEVMIIAENGKRPSPLTTEEAEEAFALDVREIPLEDRVEEPDEDDDTESTPVVVRPDGSYLAKAVRIFVYSDKNDPKDQGWGDDAKEAAEAKADLPTPWSLFHVETWRLNQRIPKPGDPKLLGSESFLRILATFWTLCNQKIVLTGSMGVDKAVRKRAERSGFGVNDIKVVVLRREYEHDTWDRPESDGEGRGYSHAFWVRGHLRNQWYPSEGRHKPKWIDAYVKGDGTPEDKDIIHVLRR